MKISKQSIYLFDIWPGCNVEGTIDKRWKLVAEADDLVDYTLDYDQRDYELRDLKDELFWVFAAMAPQSHEWYKRYEYESSADLETAWRFYKDQYEKWCYAEEVPEVRKGSDLLATYEKARVVWPNIMD